MPSELEALDAITDKVMTYQPPPDRERRSKNLIPIFNQGSELIVDSRQAAKLFKLAHQHLREQIEKHEPEMKRLGQFQFETGIGKKRPQGGGKGEKYYYLNFDQLLYLLMLTKPREDTKEYRVRLILAFRLAREKLRPIDNILLSIPEPQRKTFKDEFYIALLRIYGEVYDASQNKPQWVGNWTNKFIYEPIVKTLPNELKAKRAAYCDSTGKDPDFMRLHRFLEEHAKDELKERIAKTTVILQMSDTKVEFAENFRSLFHGLTQINFDELLSDDFGK
jgi:phage regulator Rha-like protein